MSSPALSELPGLVNRPAAEGYIYVVEFSNSTVKVGQSTDALRRINQHVNDAAHWGHEVASTWVSAPHVEYRANERSLIGYGRQQGSLIAGGEYFAGVTFADFVAYAMLLPMSPLDVAAEDARSANTQRTLRAAVTGGQGAWGDEASVLAELSAPDSELLRALVERCWGESLPAGVDLQLVAPVLARTLGAYAEMHMIKEQVAALRRRYRELQDEGHEAFVELRRFGQSTDSAVGVAQ